MENPLASLHALSQAISQAEDSEAIYIVLQQAIARQMGDAVGLAVAHYDTKEGKIHLPYVWVDGQRRQLPSYTLHEDTLTQIVQSGKPMLSHPVDSALPAPASHVGTTTFSRERFANIRFTTRTAFSVMGAPFLLYGKCFGAIAVMDYTEEARFTEEDLSFLVIIADQVAAREQVTHLFEHSQHQINRDRLLYEATTKIRSSVDMQTILENTAHELGRIFQARRVHIELNLPVLLASGGEAKNTDDPLVPGA
jgi:GAF domain-containing protein